MNIIKSTENLSPVDLYKLTMNPNAGKMKNAAGQRLEVASYALYEDVDKKTGELQQILAIQTTEGEVFATNSPTFIEEFVKMVDFFAGFGMVVDAIKVVSGVSKGGREFISVVYGN